MARRLAEGGLLIDRARPLGFSFNGQQLSGFAGDTLASALLANDKVLVGRSFKYHRPRGVLASGAEEPNALMVVGTGNRAEPNQRATTTELHEGLVARSQNHWPSLNLDVGALNAWVADKLPVFSAGFYYKTFLFPRVAWKHLYEPVIRHAAGLGPAPTQPDPDTYEHFHAHVQTLVIGGGIAGLKAAGAAAARGEKVLLVEQTAHLGGRAPAEGDLLGAETAPAHVAAAAARLDADPNVTVRLRTMAAGVYDHGYVLLYERVGDHLPNAPGTPRHRLWRVRAENIVMATGAIERPLTFANNDLPGVMLASAVRDYVRLYGVLPGSRVVVYANNDDAYRTALALHQAGAMVRAVIDVRAEANGPLPRQVRALGIEIREGHGIARAIGAKRVTNVEIGKITGSSGEISGRAEQLICDLVAMSGGWSPVVHLWSHCGGKLVWNEGQSFFHPDPDRPQRARKATQ